MSWSHTLATMRSSYLMCENNRNKHRQKCNIRKSLPREGKIVIDENEARLVLDDWNIERGWLGFPDLVVFNVFSTFIIPCSCGKWFIIKHIDNIHVLWKYLCSRIPLFMVWGNFLDSEFINSCFQTLQK